MKIITSDESLLTGIAESKSVSRRKFLGYSGAAAVALAAVVSSCGKDDNTNNNGIDLGSGDVGILNYAYALEQLEAAFYIRVLTTPYSGGSAQEMALLADIRDHEIAHREFFKNAIPAASRLQDLTPDFSSINFSDRASVLGAAKAFEDTGVSAYNGAGKLISQSATGMTYLTLAGKIVSVEARHAAYIRELITPGSFADSTVVNASGLDVAATPPQVVVIANTFLTTKISARNLPTS